MNNFNTNLLRWTKVQRNTSKFTYFIFLSLFVLHILPRNVIVVIRMMVENQCEKCIWIVKKCFDLVFWWYVACTVVIRSNVVNNMLSVFYIFMLLYCFIIRNLLDSCCYLSLYISVCTHIYMQKQNKQLTLLVVFFNELNHWWITR